jgi:hypothetical protein
VSSSTKRSHATDIHNPASPIIEPESSHGMRREVNMVRIMRISWMIKIVNHPEPEIWLRCTEWHQEEDWKTVNGYKKSFC